MMDDFAGLSLHFLVVLNSSAKYWDAHVPFLLICLSILLLVLLLLNRFSRIRLYATPESAAQQAPPPLGFSRQEHWSGLPFPSPMHESEK